MLLKRWCLFERNAIKVGRRNKNLVAFQFHVEAKVNASLANGIMNQKPQIISRQKPLEMKLQRDLRKQLSINMNDKLAKVKAWEDSASHSFVWLCQTKRLAQRL